MKRTCQGWAQRQAGQLGNILLVEAARHDGVDLDRREPGCFGRVYAVQHLVQMSPARDAMKAVGIQRVDADVDALQTRRLSAAAPDQPGAGRWSSWRCA